MKLGEALNHRKYLMGHIPEMVAALKGCITIEEGAVVNPALPTAASLRAGIDTELDELGALILKVNHANNATRLASGISLMEGIVRRDALKLKISQYDAIIAAIRPRKERQGYGAERVVVNYVVADGIHPANFRQMRDRAAKELRELEAEIQTVNWTVELPA